MIELSYTDAIEYVLENYPIETYVKTIAKVGSSSNLQPGNSISKYFCPLHNEKTPSFVIWHNTNTWKCFGACNVSGNIFNLEMKIKEISFYEALLNLTKALGVKVKTTQTDYDISEIHNIFNEYIQQGIKQDNEIGIDQVFSTNKRLNPFLIKEYKIFNAYSNFPEEKLEKIGLLNTFNQFMMSNRWIIPIYNQNNLVCGVIGERQLKEQQPKYLYSKNTPAFQKVNQVWGLNLIFNHHDTIVVTEGIYDAIKVRSAGYNAVAILGAAINSTQIKAIDKKTNKIILFFDLDEAGRNATHNFIKLYTNEHGVKANIFVPRFYNENAYPDGKTINFVDPDNLNQRQLQHYIDNAWDIKYYLTDFIKSKIQKDHWDGRNITTFLDIIFPSNNAKSLFYRLNTIEELKKDDFINYYLGYTEELLIHSGFNLARERLFPIIRHLETKWIYPFNIEDPDKCVTKRPIALMRKQFYKMFGNQNLNFAVSKPFVELKIRPEKLDLLIQYAIRIMNLITCMNYFRDKILHMNKRFWYTKQDALYKIIEKYYTLGSYSEKSPIYIEEEGWVHDNW